MLFTYYFCHMITIVVGTNRPGSRSMQIALHYKAVCQEQGIATKILSLEHHNVTVRDEAFVQLEEEYLLQAERLIIIAPEYNGGMPGILKLMIDNTDVRTVWPDKKIALVGVSSGRAGNLRGIDQLQNIFSYLKSKVYYGTLPISVVHQLLDEHGHLVDEPTQKVIAQQVQNFNQF